MTFAAIRIGTRGSKLALAQSGQMRDRIIECYPGREVELVRIKTEGDRDPSSSLAALPGVGAFTKAIELALVENRCDLAVHSLKDLPVFIDPRLVLAAIPARVDPADVLVSTRGLGDLKKGASVGTGSPRRKAQLLAVRPDLAVKPLRGNVDTRLKKLKSGELDAVVLAAAGLERLGVSVVTHRLDPAKFCPAPGQGALALECRADDAALLEALSVLDHTPTRMAVEAERAFLAAMGGGCSMPIGAYAQVEGEVMTISAVVVRPDGTDGVRDRWQGPAEAGEAGARELAEWMLARGADKILKDLAG